MRAAFLDLNGTLVMPVKVTHPAQHTLIPGVMGAIRRLNQAGYICPVVTVQSRIAKGIFSRADFMAWFAKLQTLLRDNQAHVVGPYICPHRFRDPCPCKKPQPTLYQQAAAEQGIDIAASVMIGDTSGDLGVARQLGCLGCLVRTGQGEHELAEHGAEALANYIAANLDDAVSWVLARDTTG